MIKVLVLYFDGSVDLAAYQPDVEVAIAVAGSTALLGGGKVLTDPFRIASLPVPNHEHPVIGKTGSPQPPVDGN